MSAERSHSVDRRGFLRYLGLGALGVGASSLIYQAWQNGTCFNDGTCRSCPVYTGCDLPERQVIKLDNKPAVDPDSDHRRMQQQGSPS